MEKHRQRHHSPPPTSENQVVEEVIVGGKEGVEVQQNGKRKGEDVKYHKVVKEGDKFTIYFS